MTQGIPGVRVETDLGLGVRVGTDLGLGVRVGTDLGLGVRVGTDLGLEELCCLARSWIPSPPTPRHCP